MTEEASNSSSGPPVPGSDPPNIHNHGPHKASTQPGLGSSSVRNTSSSPNIGPAVALTGSSTSAKASRESSRESSPARQPTRQQPARASTALQRSRKNSSHDVSPSRTPGNNSTATVPSAAAIQRALSATNTPQLQPSSISEPGTKIPRPQPRSNGSTPVDFSPQWPVPPRIKSPPPTTSKSERNLNNKSTQRKPDAAPPAPNIRIQRADSNSSIPQVFKGDGINGDADEQGSLTMKPSGRGASGGPPALETVQESSLPATPAIGATLGPSQPQGKYFAPNPAEAPPPTPKNYDRSHDHDGNGTGSNSNATSSSDDNRKTSSTSSDATPRAKVSKKTSFPALVPVKSRTETSSKNMTVETETVSSVAQPTIGAGPSDRAGRGDPSGSLRLKPSNETIRPKKDRKKASRKAPSITSGAASSKADIFEAKVARDVDEANSSDSEETFVYESNPPETHPRRSRHHSRTPSATSIASLDPRAGVRSIGALVQNERAVAGKRSMKFTNNPYNSPGLDDDVNSHGGTLRNPNSRSGGSIHHHHIGRRSRGPASHSAVLDSDSPFTQAQKSRSMANMSNYGSTNYGSRPNSPRVSTNFRNGTSLTRKGSEVGIYDIEADGGDDERTPLIGTVRTPRTPRTPRRPNSANLAQLDYYQRHQRSWVSRFAGCVVLTIMVLLLVFGAVGFLFAMSKPLYDVGVREIQNVLASEQEIMLDLLVEAVNPNIVSVMVTDMDVNLFAKSKFVGSERWWREHGHWPPLRNETTPTTPRRRRKGRPPTASISGPVPTPASRDSDSMVSYHLQDDDPRDPIEDPEGDSQTMLLGRIFHFDSALSFDPSPWKRHLHSSAGELRLARPGNKTEAGGTERWERVIQHPFELILRGVLKYELPLSGSEHRAPIRASVEVSPEGAVGPWITDNDVTTEVLED